MKQLLLEKAESLVLVDVPVPQISDDEVLVEVKYCGICGSDVHALHDGVTVPAGTYLGHEFSGVISEVGKNAKKWHVGDRVVVNPMYVCGECYACKHGRESICEHYLDYAIGLSVGIEYGGAFAKYVRVAQPDRRIQILPDAVSFEEGSLVEPLACSLHGIRKSIFQPRDRVMIIGAGMIGLGVAAHLRNAGAGLVVVAEIDDNKSALAKKLGADHVFNPATDKEVKDKVLDLTDGLGVDIVFECSGVPQVYNGITQYLRKGGQLLMQGVISQNVELYAMDWVLNEYQLQGSLCYYSDEFPMVTEFLSRHVSPVNEMITSKIKLSNIIKDGFGKLTRPGSHDIKIIVEPDV